MGYISSWRVAEVSFPKNTQAGKTVVGKTKALRENGDVGRTETLLTFVKAKRIGPQNYNR
jgi:hypothetical protein